MKTSNILLGFIVGAAAGATLGLLFAPEKGSDTREKLASKGGNFSQDLKSILNDFIHSLADNSKNSFTENDEVPENGKSTIEQINRNIVSEVKI